MQLKLMELFLTTLLVSFKTPKLRMPWPPFWMVNCDNVTLGVAEGGLLAPLHQYDDVTLLQMVTTRFPPRPSIIVELAPEPTIFKLMTMVRSSV